MALCLSVEKKKTLKKTELEKGKYMLYSNRPGESQGVQQLLIFNLPFVEDINQHLKGM